MKLTTFRVFVDRVRAIPRLATVASRVRVHRRHHEKWFDEDQREVVDPQLTRNLDRVVRGPAAYMRPRGQSQCLFWVEPLETALVVDCEKTLSPNTQSKLSSEILICFENARNEFDATHDLLTLLPNRQYFEKVLAESVLKAVAEPPSMTTPSVAATHDGLTLLAFDLDSFKQVNDTYGHPYGDVVLAAFAWRLEDFFEAIGSRRNLATHVARTGGEEFQVLIYGLSDTNEGLLIANEFRQALFSVPLPSDSEWLKIAARRGVAHDRLPPTGERLLSTSIGHAVTTSAELRDLMAELGGERQVGAALVSQGDVALYRAKADGRNCARSFRQIRDGLGRVLEHHCDTGIVTIDIGSEVGVKDGSEFLVYHPQFFGNHPFFQSDGRTKKLLGAYPKLASGRLQVFKTLREISFAHVLENRQVTLFQVGSRLEYVPLGSITHLVSNPLTVAQSHLASYEELIDHAASLLESKRRVVAVTFAIQDMERRVLERGTAHGNDLLASLFKSVRTALGEGVFVAMSSSSELVAIKDFGKTKHSEVLSIVTSVCTGIAKEAKCSAGVFDSQKFDGAMASAEMPIACSRLSLSASSTVAAFTDETAHSVVQAWRARRSWDEGIADYKKLLSFGIASAQLENVAGLCFAERQPVPDWQAAINCFRRAIELRREGEGGDYYQLNLAYALVRHGNLDEGLAMFGEFDHKLLGDDGISGVYLTAYVKALVLAHQSQKDLLDPERVVAVFSALKGRADLSLETDWMRLVDSISAELSPR